MYLLSPSDDVFCWVRGALWQRAYLGAGEMEAKMSDMTIERAVEVLNREKHRERDNWMVDSVGRFVGSLWTKDATGFNSLDFIDAIIIAKWYEGNVAVGAGADEGGEAN